MKGNETFGMGRDKTGQGEGVEGEASPTPFPPAPSQKLITAKKFASSLSPPSPPPIAYVTTGVVGIVFGTLILIGVAAVAITATACFFIPGCMVYNQRKSYRPKVDYDKL